MAYHVRVRLRSTIGFLLVRPVRAGVFVSVLALALTFATGPTVEGRQGACPAGSNPIACENQQPGNPASEWDISGAGDPDIQGFATDISVDQGQTVSFKIKVDDRLPAGHLSDGLLRRAGRAKGRHADCRRSTTAPSQPACLNDTTTGLIDCGNWAVTASWAVPTTAVSGIYFAKATRDGPAASATSSSSCETTTGDPTCCSRRPTRRGRRTTSTAATVCTSAARQTRAARTR